MVETEVKIRLHSAKDYEAVRNVLGTGAMTKSYEQENCQFDGGESEITRDNGSLRFRFYDGKCLVTYKGEGSIVNGVKITSEIEEFADVNICRAIQNDPSQMIQLKDHVAVSHAIKTHKPTEFKCLGSYITLREVYPWEGVNMELDKTTYEFDVAYEIEIESETPERHRDLMVELLKKNTIPHSFSKGSKFGNFLLGRIKM